VIETDSHAPLWFHVPLGEPSVPDEEYRCRLNGRKVRLALLANRFPDSAFFLGRLGPVLKQVIGWELILSEEVKADPALVVPDETVARFAAGIDGVVTAYGHCGSCTTATIRDAVKLARHALPVVALVTEVFADVARMTARAEGMSGVPIVVLPHPVARTGPERMDEIARGCADVILATLEGGR
jgi:hypothetical protein